MPDHVYKVVQLVGSSTSTIEDAIQTAIKRADQTLRTCAGLRWYKPVGTWRTARFTIIRWCSRQASRSKANTHSKAGQRTVLSKAV